MKRNNRKMIHRILQLFIIFSAFIGSWQTINDGDGGGSNQLLYFTIQSNLWIGFIHLYFLFAEWLEEKRETLSIPNSMRTLKFVLTVSISLTCIVFFVLLVPDLGWFVIELPGSMPTHFWAPIGAIIEYIFFEQKHQVTKRTPFYVLIPPLLYFVTTLFLSFNGVTYMNNEPVPYFFLNYEELGWLQFNQNGMGVVYWVILIGVLILVIGYLLMKLNQLVQKKYMVSEREETLQNS